MATPLLVNSLDKAKKRSHFLIGQGGGGLIHNNDFYLVGQRFGNLHHLHLRHR